jgi:uncharacterized membrane protein YfcA
MVQRLKKRLTRRQAVLFAAVALVEGAALAGGLLGFESAFWIGVAAANLVVLLLVLVLLNRLHRHELDERRRWSEAEARVEAAEQGPAPDLDQERVEALLRRILAGFEHERLVTTKRFEQLARSGRSADEHELS